MVRCESPELRAFNALPAPEAERALLTCCSSPRWARSVRAGRPYPDLGALCAAADAALVALSEDEVNDSLSGHPRIGGRAEGAWSRREQSGLMGADEATVTALAEANRTYEHTFGHIYLVCATGMGAPELLAGLRSRLDNNPATERLVLLQELAKINRVRLRRLLTAEAPWVP